MRVWSTEPNRTVVVQEERLCMLEGERGLEEETDVKSGGGESPTRVRSLSDEPTATVVLLVFCELLPLPLLELPELGLAERLELTLLLLALSAVFGEFLQIQIDVSPGSPASQNARAALRFGHVRACTREGLGKEGRKKGREKGTGPRAGYRHIHGLGRG